MGELDFPTAEHIVEAMSPGAPRRQDEVHAQRRAAGAAGRARGRRGARPRRRVRRRERGDTARRQTGDRQVPAGRSWTPATRSCTRTRGSRSTRRSSSSSAGWRCRTPTSSDRRRLPHRPRRHRAAPHPADAPPHPQRQPQSDRRRVHRGGARAARRTGAESTTCSCSATRPTSPSATPGASQLDRLAPGHAGAHRHPVHVRQEVRDDGLPPGRRHRPASRSSTSS